MPLTGKKGFSLLEVLLVVGILATIVAFTVSGFQNYTRYQQYDYGVTTVVSSITNARDNAKRGVGGEPHGVKLASTSVTLFDGAVYDSSDPENVVVDLTNVSITFSLTDGTDEIVFAALTGLPSATGTVVITGTEYTASTSATIDAIGAIQ